MYSIVKNKWFYSTEKFLLYIDIIDKCNYNCAYCSTKNYRKNKNNYLNLNKLTTFIKNTKHLQNKKIIIQLLGGEPTLHPDLKKFIKENPNYIINIYTNFSESINYYNDLLNFKNFELTISYHFNNTNNTVYNFFNKYIKLHNFKNIFNIVLFEHKYINQNINLFKLFLDFYQKNNISMHNLDISLIDNSNSYNELYTLEEKQYYDYLYNYVKNKHD